MLSLSLASLRITHGDAGFVLVALVVDAVHVLVELLEVGSLYDTAPIVFAHLTED